MSLLPLRSWSARHHGQPAGQLPAPGPFPAAQPQDAVVVFVVVLVVLVWLLAHGYSAAAAFRIVAVAGALAASITARLAATQPEDGRGPSRM
jgi:hypothetical protein